MPTENDWNESEICSMFWKALPRHFFVITSQLGNLATCFKLPLCKQLQQIWRELNKYFNWDNLDSASPFRRVPGRTCPSHVRIFTRYRFSGSLEWIELLIAFWFVLLYRCQENLDIVETSGHSTTLVWLTQQIQTVRAMLNLLIYCSYIYISFSVRTGALIYRMKIMAFLCIRRQFWSTHMLAVGSAEHDFVDQPPLMADSASPGFIFQTIAIPRNAGMFVLLGPCPLS